jgi:hypothetical protein
MEWYCSFLSDFWEILDGNCLTSDCQLVLDMFETNLFHTVAIHATTKIVGLIDEERFKQERVGMPIINVYVAVYCIEYANIPKMVF